MPRPCGMGSVTEMLEVMRRFEWRPAGIVEAAAETWRMKSVVIEVPGWAGHRPGQHVDVRLNNDGSYQGQRSYSIASRPQTGRLTLLVGRHEGAELASCLFDGLRQGDKLYLRGPSGIAFSWKAEMGGPLLLVAGGCGIAPLMSMIRQRSDMENKVPTRLLYSSRSPDDIAYRGELDHIAKTDVSLEVIHTLTRTRPPGWAGYRRRIDREMLHEISWRPEESPLIYICGPTPMVTTVAGGFAELGHDPLRIKKPRAAYRR
jgi:ferredoxin-NADP reductase